MPAWRRMATCAPRHVCFEWAPRILNTYRIYGLNLNVLLAAVLWFWFCFCFVPNIQHTPLPTRSFLARRLLRSCGQRTRLMTLSGAGRIAFVPSKGIPFVNTLCHRMGPKSLKKPSMDMSQPRKKSFGQPGAGQVSWKSEDEAFATSSCPPSLRASLRTPHVWDMGNLHCFETSRSSQCLGSLLGHGQWQTGSLLRRHHGSHLRSTYFHVAEASAWLGPATTASSVVFGFWLSMSPRLAPPTCPWNCESCARLCWR